MSDSISSDLIFEVDETNRGKRLDRFLSEKVSELSRSQVQQLIKTGNVQVNHKSSKSSHLLSLSDNIQIHFPLPTPSKLIPEKLPLEILYEDDEVLVLNKTAEMVVHPGAGVKEGTLVHALLHHAPQIANVGGAGRPGIVHRLDKGTSGVMMVAKTPGAYQKLVAQFQSREVTKVYLAFVWGNMRDLRGVINMPLGRSARDRKKISSKSRRTREAVTSYHVLKKWKEISLLKLEPKTGRTHQLRVHLTEIGHPIVGDPVYGRGLRRAKFLTPSVSELVEKLHYQLLHSACLSFFHPQSGELLTFEAPMREEMKQLEKSLEKK